MQVVWSVLVVALPLSLSLGGNALAEQPVRSLPQTASCPYGFYRSGDRCLSTPGSTRKAVEKVGTFCPLGWFSSGSYCVRYR
ncbi:hypothetical protein KBY76_00815 [Synechococcus sp. GreenBA-s]|nr:hypothetical protein [Synechococcus sp. GreenBA-s]